MNRFLFILSIFVVASFSFCKRQVSKMDKEHPQFLIDGLNEFSFQFVIDSIEIVNGEICQRSKIYKWRTFLPSNKDALILDIGAYRNNCSHELGHIFQNSSKVIFLGKQSFLLSGKYEYSFDSFRKAYGMLLDSSRQSAYIKELFLYYPDEEINYDFSPFLKGISEFIEFENIPFDSLPVFYFMENINIDSM